MKPAPPDHLLGPGQTWIVVEAPGWVTVFDGTCSIRWTDPKHGFLVTCQERPVIMYTAGVNLFQEVLCEQHMGYHRWVENGKVMQWYADPPWEYGWRRPKLPPRRRTHE